MSLYYCSITGEICEAPVVSKKTGHIYERRLIEKHIDATQLDPITSQPLTRDDIVALQVNNTIKPRPVSATGVADLITIFQSEWDALMLETYTLKQNLENVRQELSHALYQHDAACRVIARLMKERDDAREEATELAHDGVGREGGAMDEEVPTGALPQEVVQSIVDRKAQLNAMRKERRKNKEVLEKFASAEAISGYKKTNSLPLHSTTKPGIVCLDINSEDDNLIVTGGNDGSVIFYNKAHDKIVNTFEKHQKKITDVKFVPAQPLGAQGSLCLVSSEDSIGHLLTNNQETGKIDVAYRVNQHRDALVACAVHPTSSIGLFCSRDGSFSYHDLSQGRLMSYVTVGRTHLRTLRIHPDGHIIALGDQNGVVRIWDVLQHTQVAEIKAHDGPIEHMNFSENGVNFATSSYHDKKIKLWDLRELSAENFKVVDENSGGAVSFDQFGSLLAVGTTSLRIINIKDMEEVARMDDHKDVITSIQFGNYSKYIATASLDRNLNIYS